MLPVIGLPLGKLQGPTFRHLKERGYELPAYDPERRSREYKIETGFATFVLDNSRDLVTRVALGDLNAAVVGGDSVAELKEEANVFWIGGNPFYCSPNQLEVTDLSPYITWALVVLVGQQVKETTFEAMLKRLISRDKRYPVVSWTEYPYLQKDLIQCQADVDIGIFGRSQGEVMIFPSAGSTESKLRRGDSVFGLEVVSTGETARLNDLRRFAETAVTYQPAIIKPEGYSHSFVERLTRDLTDD